MARPELEVPRDHLVVQGDRGIAVGDRFVPTDANGRQLINHYGPAGTFPTEFDGVPLQVQWIGPVEVL